MTRAGKRNITPTDMKLGFSTIENIIEKERPMLREVLETFLKNPEPLTWVPPSHTSPSNYEFLKRLRIPSYRNGRPSLLFRDLDACDGNEIARIFEGDESLYYL